MTRSVREDISRSLCEKKKVLCHVEEFEVCGKNKCYYVKRKVKKQVNEEEAETG